MVNPVIRSAAAGASPVVGSAPARFGLVFNPAAGAASSRAVERLAGRLRQAGREVSIFPTTAAGGGTQQAIAALQAGCDAVVACGGDGTLNEALQAVVADGGRVPLGIFPLGTGNVIAHDLRIRRRVEKAATLLLAPRRRRVTVGRVECSGATRYFLGLVGVGCDAHALYHLSAALKSRFGMLGYYWQSFRSLLASDFAPFEVEFATPEGPRRETVSQLLAVRITDFGGLLRRLAPGAALERDDLRLVLFRARGRLPYIRYMTAVVLGQLPRVPGVELVYAGSLVCRAPAAAGGVYAQADGEYLGRAPVHVTLVPSAVELLVPPESPE